ncbi:hypothetical protein O6H91_07G002900 [Diphasiastrum complanatum]|uniref:Uncharacterized protein n=1 Tax=Diphasiastrum complanatum TaxID=34168 RepID=A0ACC2D1U3_DIPCM|nr:hypothetical protein O6H91_07G002900 [Diphasiastrum complanatum]
MVDTKPLAHELICEIPGVRIYADGSVDRSAHDQVFPTASADPDWAVHGAVSKDVMIDSITGIWVRIYLPQSAKCSSQICGESNEDGCLPIVVYFHGGGFIVASAASSFAHDICCKMSAKLNVIVVSVDYRLAPEHRLPAAFDDAFSALKWLQLQAAKGKAASEKEPWLAAYGDYQQCFLMGQSSGATMVHHIALRCSTEDMFPLQIRGLILEVPFFGGLERTYSELKFGNTYVDGVLQMKLSDDFWAFSLPVGADRSHRYADFSSSDAPDLALFQLPPSLLILGGRDPYYDRAIQYVEALKRGGHGVTVLEYPEKDHAINFPEVEGDMENAYTKLKIFLSLA